MNFDNSVALRHKDLELSKLRIRDRLTYINLREHSSEWLLPWDATLPATAAVDRIKQDSNFNAASTAGFASIYLAARRSNQAGTALTLGMRTRGKLIGIITAANITTGAARNCQVGYWIDQRFAGRGFTPRAVALLIDYLILERQLHRVEIAIRPENQASLRVVEKLELRSEGLRPRYLHINGDWRDHLIFAIDSSEIGTGLISKFG
jgi:[ribosomal protein S5]-alanine N-acetyltransferase